MSWQMFSVAEVYEHGYWLEVFPTPTEESYDFFKFIADAPCPRPGEFAPICEAKGLPDDWSTEKIEDYGADYGHHHTWHMLDTLLEHPHMPNFDFFYTDLKRLAEFFPNLPVRVVVWFQN